MNKPRRSHCSLLMDDKGKTQRGKRFAKGHTAAKLPSWAPNPRQFHLRLDKSLQTPAELIANS